MPGAFGLLDDHHARVPVERFVENHPCADIVQLHQNGLLLVGASARLHGGKPPRNARGRKNRDRRNLGSREQAQEPAVASLHFADAAAMPIAVQRLRRVGLPEVPQARQRLPSLQPHDPELPPADAPAPQDRRTLGAVLADRTACGRVFRRGLVRRLTMSAFELPLETASRFDPPEVVFWAWRCPRRPGDRSRSRTPIEAFEPEAAFLFQARQLGDIWPKIGTQDGREALSRKSRKSLPWPPQIEKIAQTSSTLDMTLRVMSRTGGAHARENLLPMPTPAVVVFCDVVQAGPRHRSRRLCG